MCFAMREGIVDQQSDVCGDVETNVNVNEESPSAPFEPLRSPPSRQPPFVFPRPSSPRPPFPYTSPLRSTPLSISSSFSFSLDILHCFFEFSVCARASYLYIHIDLLYSTLYICANVCMCGRRIVYIIGIPYVKCESKRIREHSKYVCIHNTGCGRVMARAIISDRDML